MVVLIAALLIPDEISCPCPRLSRLGFSNGYVNVQSWMAGNINAVHEMSLPAADEWRSQPLIGQDLTRLVQTRVEKAIGPLETIRVFQLLVDPAVWMHLSERNRLELWSSPDPLRINEDALHHDPDGNLLHWLEEAFQGLATQESL